MQPDLDIDADTGTVRPRVMQPPPAPMRFGSVELNPQLATTVTIFALGFFACLAWQMWTDKRKS